MGIFENIHLEDFTFLESIDKSSVNHKFKKGKYSDSCKFIDFHDKKINSYIKTYKCLQSESIRSYISFCRKTREGEIVIDTFNDKLIGSIFVIDKGDQKLMGGLYVDEDYRGQGIGEKLFDDAVNKYHGNTLGVYEDNKVAIRLYKKYGFKVTEKKKDENGDIYLIMTK